MKMLRFKLNLCVSLIERVSENTDRKSMFFVYFSFRFMKLNVVEGVAINKFERSQGDIMYLY